MVRMCAVQLIFVFEMLLRAAAAVADSRKGSHSGNRVHTDTQHTQTSDKFNGCRKNYPVILGKTLSSVVVVIGVSLYVGLKGVSVYDPIISRAMF